MTASPLMSEADAIAYLGLRSRKELNALLKPYGFRRHPVTGTLARSDVERVAAQIEQEIIAHDAAKMGPEEQAVGSQPGFRTKPHLV